MNVKLFAQTKDYYGHLWVCFFHLISFSFIPSFLQLMNGLETSDFVISFVIGGTVVFCTPAVFLFFRYVSLNKNISIEYLNDEIHVFKNGTSRVIDLNDIDRVKIKVSLPVYYDGFRYFATDSYFYAVIQLQNGECFTITSLIDNELIETEFYFKEQANIRVEKSWSFICWPPSHCLSVSGQQPT